MLTQQIDKEMVLHWLEQVVDKQTGKLLEDVGYFQDWLRDRDLDRWADCLQEAFSKGLRPFTSCIHPFCRWLSQSDDAYPRLSTIHPQKIKQIGTYSLYVQSQSKVFSTYEEAWLALMEIW